MRDLTRSRDQLIAENALLRQQLIVASRKVKRPVFKPHERGLMVLLSRIVRGWRDAVLLVKPATILRWRREGFRLFWKLKSRKRKPAESKISAEQIALIRQRVVHVGVTRATTAEWTAGIGQRVPIPSSSQIYRKGAKINSVPVLGGLHHDYEVAA